MLEIKDMKLLAALARHRHFARAAAASGISQPAFSARIRKIEASFGLPLVRRGNKFQGFSREGEVLLKWCRKILADVEGMRQEMEMSKGALGGKLVIGAVPTALPYAALLSGRLREVHPDLAIEIRSLTSSKIGLGLDDYSLDAGLTYVGAENIGDKLLLEPIYEETYVLVASKALAPRAAGHATWAEAAALPLCLLFASGSFITLVALPPFIVFLGVFTLGFGLMLAAVNVYFRDVEHIIAAIATPWFFLTPIFYTFSALPTDRAPQWLLHVLYYGNPITPYVSAIREIVFAGDWPGLGDWVYCAAVAAITLVSGFAIFRRLEGDMAVEL